MTAANIAFRCPTSDAVHRWDRLQYYDRTAVCSDDRKFARLIQWLRSYWTLSASKIESSEDFTQQVLPHRRANARMAFRQTFHCVPKGVRRWLTYSFSARAPVRPISTGLKTGWVVFKSPPRVPIPVRCPACGQMHKWVPPDGSIGPALPSRAPRLLSGSQAAS
jgi:hypothetical protein